MTQPSPAPTPPTATTMTCGWTLGLLPGHSCDKPTEGGHCEGHRRAERRIRRKTAAFAKEGAALLAGDRALSRKTLRAAGDPRKRAEEWWVTSGARQVPRPLREDVLNLPYNTCCTYCGGRWADVTDHILPVAAGGLSERENLAAACGSCNAEKSDATPEQWRARRIAGGLSWPPESWQILVIRAVSALLAEEPIPAFLADLAYRPRYGATPPSSGDYEDDPRWQTAQAALFEQREDLTSREAWLRWQAGLMVSLWVELEYEEDRCAACGIASETHGADCGVENWDRDDLPAKWVVDLGVAKGSAKEIPVLLADRKAS